MKEPSTPFANLPLEQEAIRAKCFHPSGTFVEFPIEDVEKSIPERFEKIVRQHADRIAVKTDTGSATYSQLNDMANGFAHALQQAQGRRAQPVALLLEKDVAQVAAMLGAMKAGKFFLILDPSFPKYRLAAMLKGSRAKLVVTNRRNASLADEIATSDCELIQWEAIDDSFSRDNPEISIAPKALAFINYTSGSTGEPKALLRSHRMILHNIMLRTNLMHVCELDRISLLSSGTSNAITNSLLALLNGAGLYSLEVKKQGVVRPARWLAEGKITITPMSSPLFRALCETLKGKNNFPDLRVVRLRSEAVYKSDADLYRQYFSPDCIFVTGLSSNETGPLADYFIDHDTVVTDSVVPVGYAAPGKEVVLLNQDGERIGFDEVGEIAVRSRYLSPGYLRNSRLAKTKFKCDPTESGSRIYLTGDMGLMLPNGCLIYKGRKDFRVKVRGYPVDIKEVETALRAHPSLRDVVVIARSSRSGETVLVAYFVTAARQVPTVSELMRFLARMLPDYMIPAAFVRLASMPLNPQNKVDRAALPSPAEMRPDLDTPFMAPRGDEEREVADIWAEVLGIDRVGIQDNFLELGGHSLAAARIVTRVTEKFHSELPLQVLFDSPTVEKMALVITENQSAGHRSGEHGSKPSNDAVPARSGETAIGFTSFPKEDLERSIPERFEKIVRLYPDRIAVKSGNEVVNYAQLNAMANRIARAIIDRRGSDAEAIAIFAEKGPRLMAAMLAVLKAGKFFVLLDSSFPKAHNEDLLEDSQAGLVVADWENASLARDITANSGRLLELGSLDLTSISENIDLRVMPQSFATIVYTSGSTGDPKGVIWNHEDLLHRIMLRTLENRVRPDDRIALLPTGTANMVTNSFLALLNGAMLCPFAMQKEGVIRVAKWLSDEGITICPFSASLFRSFTAVLSGQETFPDLRIVRLRSETVHKSDFELFKKHFSGHCKFVTGLSTSETGQLTTFLLNHDSVIPDGGVPIGYPTEDKEILLLDDAGDDVGANQVGEIVVRSPYLAVGYWRRPELTATKFRADPNGGENRLCFTGDLGLRLPGGCLVHKGRKDFRVKIRGYGVELAEVERRILGHSGVKEAVVVARQAESGDARLIAYYTGAGNPLPRSKELRDFLEKKLPQYMIPAAFVLLDAMPSTPNGKINRRALPGRDNLRPELAAAYQPPRNETERILVSIWENVLDVRPVGVNDGFFDLGGDSLLATRVIAQVVEHFQLEIPLQWLFQSPTINELAALVAQRQGELSSLDKVVHAATPPVVLKLREGFLPLSYSQQRLWFLDRLDPGSCTYNLFSAYRLKGELNVEALEQSFNEIIRRHEILRTVFKSEGGEPYQVVVPSLAIKITQFDLRRIVSEEDRWAEVRRQFTEEAQRPFDLAIGPLLRIKLLQLADDAYVLLRTMHHIVSDGWSWGVLSHELSEIYAAFSNGEPSPLADLTRQYSDYAAWQRRWFQGQRLESQLSFWKKQLDNIAILNLPTDRPRQALRARLGARRYFALSDEISSELKKLSHQHAATLFMTLLAAFQTLLHRYSGQTDIAVGSPVAGRSRKEFEQLIGFFLNILVLRLDLSGNPTFIEILRRAREVCLQALSHQDLPFEKLVEKLDPDRNLSHNPLFQISFVFQNTPRVSPKLSDIVVEELEVDTGIARFDLHLFMEEIDGQLKGYCHYNTDLFNADTIERLLGHFQTLLHGIVGNPDQRISDLPMLSEAERHQLLVEWNHTKTDYPTNECVHQLFEAQVDKTPNAVAVVLDDQQLTYQELNNQANQLAHHLRKVGVGPDVLVAICVETSIKMIVGLLGILKAGGAYVPLDPSYPKDRLDFLLKDAHVGVVLTEVVSLTRLPPTTARVICIDRVRKELAREPHGNTISLSKADSLAYVIYTSGSTGQPKGVAVSHRAVNRLVMNTDYVQVTPSEVIAQASNVSFDAATFEIWGALLNGARLVLIAKDTLLSPQCLSTAIGRHGITTLFLTTALFNQMVEQIPGALGKLRYLLFGGEPADPQKVKLLFKDPPMRLLHVYGPTETTTFASWYRVEAIAADATTLPIGRPIAGTDLYILDQHLAPVPIGVAGELHIGGDGLAWGYLNHPELTREKFVAHPFSSDATDRLYKTGDLVRYLVDGNIEFLGRIDDQVKIRGYRIELGEIESMLAQHPAIQQAVVLAREDNPGDKRLAAYLVTANGSAISAHDLRNFLQHKFPDYMVPSAFVFLDSLPLTPNGKLDRKMLPAPTEHSLSTDHCYVAPRDELETTLSRLWSETLGAEKVGIDDDFFALGGHSLLAAKLFTRMDEAIGRSLPLSVLFERPNIRALAEHYRASELRKTRSLVALRTTGQLPPIFAVPGVYGNVVGFADLARELGPDQPLYCLQSLGLDGRDAPLDSIESMASLYTEELRSVQSRGPYALVGACFGATVAYEMTRQLLRMGHEVAFLGLLDPTRREGQNSGTTATSARALKIAALRDLVAGRLHLYIKELSQLSAKARLRFLATKLGGVGASLAKRNRLKGVLRELNQIAVYKANVRALHHYQKVPILGSLRTLEIFETSRRMRIRGSAHSAWAKLWHGPILIHNVSGKDSGDMISGHNARQLASLLAQRLSAAFHREPESPKFVLKQGALVAREDTRLIEGARLGKLRSSGTSLEKLVEELRPQRDLTSTRPRWRS